MHRAPFWHSPEGKNKNDGARSSIFMQMPFLSTRDSASLSLWFSAPRPYLIFHTHTQVQIPSPNDSLFSFSVEMKLIYVYTRRTMSNDD